MNDHELIEMAAKAAGITLREPSGALLESKNCRHVWNPLAFNDDALGLAVRLRMNIRLDDPAASAAGWSEHQRVPFTSDGKGPWYWKEWHSPRLPADAALRLAIVRAAAEVAEK